MAEVVQTGVEVLSVEPATEELRVFVDIRDGGVDRWRLEDVSLDPERIVGLGR